MFDACDDVTSMGQGQPPLVQSHVACSRGYRTVIRLKIAFHNVERIWTAELRLKTVFQIVRRLSHSTDAAITAIFATHFAALHSSSVVCVFSQSHVTATTCSKVTVAKSVWPSVFALWRHRQQALRGRSVLSGHFCSCHRFLEMYRVY